MTLLDEISTETRSAVMVNNWWSKKKHVCLTPPESAYFEGQGISELGKLSLTTTRL